MVRKCHGCNLPATNIFNSETDLENFAMGPTSSFVTALGDALFLTAPSNADMVEDTIVNSTKDTKIRFRDSHQIDSIFRYIHVIQTKGTKSIWQNEIINRSLRGNTK